MMMRAHKRALAHLPAALTPPYQPALATLGARGLHDAGSLQRKLMDHPSCANARVLPLDEAGARLCAVVRPRSGVMASFKVMGNPLGHTAGNESLLDLAQKLLCSGDVHRIEFISRERSQDHEYSQEGILLNELLRAVHRSTDRDGDGFITADELCSFLEAHGLAHVASRELVRAEDGLSFHDFKALLLETTIVSIDGIRYELGEQSSLLTTLSEAFFRDADLDGDGVILLTELEHLFQYLGMGSQAARKYFLAYDADGSGGIDLQEFKHMLFGQEEPDEPLLAYDF